MGRQMLLEDFEERWIMTVSTGSGLLSASQESWVQPWNIFKTVRKVTTTSDGKMSWFHLCETFVCAWYISVQGRPFLYPYKLSWAQLLSIAQCVSGLTWDDQQSVVPWLECQWQVGWDVAGGGVKVWHVRDRSELATDHGPGSSSALGLVVTRIHSHHLTTRSNPTNNKLSHIVLLQVLVKSRLLY